MSYFTDFDRGGVKLGVTGDIRTPQKAESALAAGADWIMLGRAAMLHHDFPNQYQNDPNFTPVEVPVTREHLHREGLSDTFLTYISWLDGFVVEDGAGDE
jgi:2,4-dienoyl-CoA reductase-like NADH-dependent reductase (Old Yellow Enzyme family)